MDKQTFFESPHALENAEVMLDVCREEYEQAGRRDDAQALRGLEVTSLAAAQLALLTVRNLPVIAGLAEAREYTIRAVYNACQALHQTQRLAS